MDKKNNVFAIWKVLHGNGTVMYFMIGITYRSLVMKHLRFEI